MGHDGKSATKFGSGVPGVKAALPPCSNRIRTGSSPSNSASAWSYVSPANLFSNGANVLTPQMAEPTNGAIELSVVRSGTFLAT